jgi:hypothetical protein
MHELTCIVVPKEIFLQGEDKTLEYIERIMEPFSTELEVDEHIECSRKTLEAEFEEYKIKKTDNKYADYKEYADKYRGYRLDDQGNAVSTFNDEAWWDWYTIGGRWAGLLSGSGFEYRNIINNSIKIKYIKNLDIETYVSETGLQDLTPLALSSFEQDDYIVAIDYHS